MCRTARSPAHAERNGNHYVRGLEFLTAAEQALALRDFPSLYERTEGGLVRLKIDGGVIRTGEINKHPYGMSAAIDFAPPYRSLPLPDPGASRSEPRENR